MPAFNHLTKKQLLSNLADFQINQSLLDRVLPNWWNEEFLSSSSGLLELCVLIKSRLGLNVHVSEKGDLIFESSNRSIQYKRQASTAVERLIPATAVGQGMASTVVSGLQAAEKAPPSKVQVETTMRELHSLDLRSIVDSLWEINIPVLYLEDLPSTVPKPAGMIVRIEEYIVIVLAHKDRSPAAQSFVVAHELGHYVQGHVDHTDMLTDVTLVELDHSLAEDADQQEFEADQFALGVLRRGLDIQDFFAQIPVRPSSAQIASKASKFGREFQIPAAHLALSYGKETKDWATAHSALRFLEKGESASSIISESFAQHIGALAMRSEEINYIERLFGASFYANATSNR